jgi:dual specificity tyrosine-phosphorylation-regulated kinase 2/3/4
MQRSKIEELKFLRVNSLKRPNTSSYLAYSKIIVNEKKATNNTIKLNTPIDKLSLHNTQLAKPDIHINLHNNFTPDAYKSRTKIPLLSSKNGQKIFHPIKPLEMQNPPYPTSEFLKYFRNELNKNELSEILDYSVVYYWGKDKKLFNFYGFDDEKGNYIGQVNDHIAYRYQITKILGKGSFGQVYECYDHKEHLSIALKIVKSRQRFNCQAHTEIRLLKLLMEHDPEDTNCILHIKDYFIFRNHICICTELLGNTLYETLKLNNLSGLPIPYAKKIAIQILKSLKYLKKLKIIHCDLKPENVLLTKYDPNKIKLIDFGSSCAINEKVYSYIQSRYYRAPEIILGLGYEYPIDMWSFGCVLFEVLIGHPLFQADSEIELLHKIIKVKGLIPEKILANASKKDKFFSDSKMISDKNGNAVEPMSLDLLEMVRGDSLVADLLHKCFEWDPKKRITPEQALNHSWFKPPNLNFTEFHHPLQKSTNKKSLIINYL